ncbi:DNA polymerase delta catalytic subunit-like [Anser cygnoides]|uniref:DNA polymerase delta catalytic subunit-like n=1 Tax=Anser cygnoides TaxID=8845 RepID=UPI0034D27A46
MEPKRPPPRRPRPSGCGGVPAAPSRFEAELAQLEELEAELEAERAAHEEPPGSGPRGGALGSQFVGEVNPKWRRPRCPPTPAELCFLQLEIDHYVGEGAPHRNAPPG